MAYVLVDNSLRDNVTSLVRERIEKAQLWLASIQQANGSWLNSPWHTAKIMIALLETGLGADDPKIIRAYEWLTDKAATRIDPTMVCWDNWTWDTALVIRALHRLASEKARSDIRRALTWLVREEKREVRAPSSLLSFGRCYSAQVVLALVETGEDAADIDFFARHLQNLQEKGGGWISTFDSAQIIEALVASGVAEKSRQWTVRHVETGEEYPGGIDLAISWIEGKQLLFGNWDGLTWPTTWILRAYLKAANHYNQETVMLALAWLLEQKAPDGSWFHEPARTASCMLTFNEVLALRRKLSQNGIDLDQSYSRFILTASNLRKEHMKEAREQPLPGSHEYPKKRDVQRRDIGTLLRSLRHKWFGS